MPEIKAFRGWRYNPDRVKHLWRVYAPPYDVISKKEQAALYRRSPYNVIRLELGRQRVGDSASENRYTRAARTLRAWKSKRVLTQDLWPSLYVYTQEYKESGKKRLRVGFLAAMKLDPRSVLRHENTLAAPKQDRFALLKKVRTNLSPVFGLFQDRGAAVQSLIRPTLKRAPIIDALISGVRHRVYLEDSPSRIRAVRRAVRTKPMFIADGHHRFEVACRFKDWMRSKSSVSSGAGWEYAMVYLSDCLHNPFRIFPTHRLIRLPENTDIFKLLAPVCKVARVKNLQSVLARLHRSGGRYVFGLYARRHGFYILTLRDRLPSRTGPGVVDRLDVAVLHRRILEPCFGIGSLEKTDGVDFTRDPEEACRRVRQGLFSMALFLGPTSLKQMIEVSKKGLKMPQKSTYFYPKLLTGLVFHSFEPGGRELGG